MSKYQISDVPMYKPHKCANCGSSKNDGRRYIDFGLEIDWLGTIFLCGFCLRDVANTMGLFDDLNAQIKELQEKDNHIEEMQVQGEHLHEVVLKTFEEVTVYYDNLHSLGCSSTTDSGSDLVIEEPAVEPRVDESKPRAVKQTSSSRRQNVPSLADLLNAESGPS